MKTEPEQIAELAHCHPHCTVRSMTWGDRTGWTLFHARDEHEASIDMTEKEFWSMDWATRKAIIVGNLRADHELWGCGAR